MELSRYLMVIVLFAAASATAFSQESDRRDVRRGNRQFKDGNYKEAVVDYQKALLRDSSSFAASYNLANALYRMENYSEAKSVLDTVAESAPASEHASDYYYNSGNTAVSLQDYQAAVDAYREALLRNPGDLDAKENYIYARKKLEDRQNNQNNQNGQDNQDNQDNKDKNGDDGKDGGNDNRDQDNQDDGNGQNGDNGNNSADDSRDDGQSGQQPQTQPQISKQAAQQMLNAIMAREKETQDKVNKEKAAVMKSRQKEKNW